MPSWTLVLLVLLILGLSYSNSLYSPLVLDDINSFVESPQLYIEDFSLQSLNKLCTTRFGPGRLIPLLTFAIDHRLGQGSILQYHVTNILIHIATTCILFVFLAGLLRFPSTRQTLKFFSTAHYCLFVIALWALSPVQTNAVTYLVQRMASLVALFYLSALACYVYARLSSTLSQRLILLSGCVVSAILALLSKENSVTLPLAIALVEGMIITPDLPGRILRSLKGYHWVLLGLFIMLCLPLGEKTWYTFTSAYDMRHFTLEERLLTEARIVVFYLSLLALPLPGRLNLDHDFSVSHSLLEPPSTLVSLLFLAGLLFAAWWARDRSRLAAFGIVWFFLNLLIESTVFPLELIFEHRLYLPSLGFFMVVTALMDMAFFKVYTTRQTPDLKAMALLLLVIMSSASALLTTFRNHDWRDLQSIYTDCLEKSPRKPRVLVNLGVALAQDKQFEASRQLMQKAITVGRPNDEDFVRAATNIVGCFLQENRLDEAITNGEEFLKGIRNGMLADEIPSFVHNLGVAYNAKGRFKDAYDVHVLGLRYGPDKAFLYAGLERLLQAANLDENGRAQLQLSGKAVDVPLHMAALMLAIRQYDRARTFLEQAKALDPENEAVKSLSTTYSQTMTKNSLAAAQSALEKDSPFAANASCRFLLGVADFILERYTPLRAVVGPIIETAGRSDLTTPFVPTYKARWHLAMGRPEAAVQTVEAVLPKFSDFPPLLEMAGTAYRLNNQPDKAGIVFEHLLNLYPGQPNWRSFMDLTASQDKENGAAAQVP